MILVCGISFAVIAEESNFESGWYAGVGAGQSRLKPDTGNTAYSVSDSASQGWKLLAGYDWNKRFSIEGYFADLGEARLSPNGTVEYQDIGVNGLYYFYNNQKQESVRTRRNLSLFGKAGIGYMMNSSDVNYDRVHDAHIVLGAGLEYLFSSGFSVRAEAEFFDEDSQQFSISILKRFGKSVR